MLPNRQFAAVSIRSVFGPEHLREQGEGCPNTDKEQCPPNSTTLFPRQSFAKQQGNAGPEHRTSKRNQANFRNG